MLNENQQRLCACKGIRKCVLCAPDLINQQLRDERNIFQTINNLYIYCPKCNQSVLVTESKLNLICDFIEKQINEINCTCNQTQESTIKINGIFIKNDFISVEEEQFLVSEITKSKWVESQSGRFKQDYGPKANFNKKKLKYSSFTGLPEYSKFLIDRLKNFDTKNIENFVPVELCNLKYESNRAACIDPHFDDFWLWGERLITFNLLENTFLTLIPGKDVNNFPSDTQILLPLSRRSIIFLSNDARYKWMHAIKKSHIKSTRLAITIRELTEEFKSEEKHGTIGKTIENLAMSFKGISVGTIEDFFKETLNVNYEIQNSILNLDDSCFFTSLLSLDYLTYDNDINKSNLSIEDIDYFHIGIILAKWTIDSKKILNDLINQDIIKHLEQKSVYNFILIFSNITAYLGILQNYLLESKMDLSLKSKMVASVFKVRDILMLKNELNEIIDLVHESFDLNNINYESLDKIKFRLESNQNKYISIKLNNLSRFIAKIIKKFNYNYNEIEKLIHLIIKGYSSKQSIDLKLLNILIFLNLILNSELKDYNLIENFYLINFV